MEENSIYSVNFLPVQFPHLYQHQLEANKVSTTVSKWVLSKTPNTREICHDAPEPCPWALAGVTSPALRLVGATWALLVIEKNLTRVGRRAEV